MDKNTIKISIVTISYNSGAEIEDTIKSVIKQSYPNKEYLIIDGGSKDCTMDVVNRYRDKIDYMVSEPDKGRSDAFNKGIKAATGDYIVMINAGDMLTPNALNDFVKYYEPGYDIIKGNTIRWDADTGYKSIETPVIKYPAIPFNFYVCHQSTYISKLAYEKAGGYRVDFKVVMDFELMLRMTKSGCKFKRIPADLAVFRMGGISQMSKHRRYDEMKKAMELNGRDWLQTFTFMIYLHLRTFIRDILNKINPDLKSRLITHTIKNK